MSAHLHPSPVPVVGTQSSPPRLKATRTYGRPRARKSSPEYGSASSSSWHTLSSSPMPSSLLVTPPSSPPCRIAKRAHFEIAETEDDNMDASTAEPSHVSSGRAEQKVISLPVAKAAAAVKQGTLKGFFTAAPRPKTKAPLQTATTIFSPSPASSSRGPSSSIIASTISKAAQMPTLQQSHLLHLPLMQSCKACGMTYVRGGEDEGVHARHHGRVMGGIPWEGLGRGVGKSQGKGGNKGDKGWKEVSEVTFGSGTNMGKGRIVVCDGSWGGAKLEDILATVDLSLSSPPLPSAILDRCRIFLLLTSSPPPPRPTVTGKRQRPEPSNSSRSRSSSSGISERIVSVVVGQGIRWAMRVLGSSDIVNGSKINDGGERIVDSGGGVMCDPTPLNTPLGIHRLYTIPSYRSLGLAQALLESARDHTVYGCSFDPTKGQIAFSQPTESGRAVMEKWGGGAVRVFVDDESQI